LHLAFNARDCVGIEARESFLAALPADTVENKAAEGGSGSRRENDKKTQAGMLPGQQQNDCIRPSGQRDRGRIDKGNCQQSGMPITSRYSLSRFSTGAFLIINQLLRETSIVEV